MRNKFTMEMSICQAENGFSLDELVKKLADAFNWCHSMYVFYRQ